MNPISSLNRLFRRIRSVFRSIVTFPARINLVDTVVSAFAFPQYKWVRRLRQNLADEGQDVTWQQTFNPLYWAAWTFRFSKRWLTTRPYMALAPAIPAMLCAGLLAATVIAVMRRDETSTQTVYLDRLRLAMKEDQVSLASVAAQRLLQIDPENQEHQYQLALLDIELGKRESAELSMLRLAVEKEYGPAALWLLRSLVYPGRDFRRRHHFEFGGEKERVVGRTTSVVSPLRFDCHYESVSRSRKTREATFCGVSRGQWSLKRRFAIV